MILVAEAQARLFALASPLLSEILPLPSCFGRYLAEDVKALRNQPAADLSAMDGYAIRFSNLPGPWKLIGESAAGSPFTGKLNEGETIRIFTGAHVPDGADTVMVQEETNVDDNIITLSGEGPTYLGKNIRISCSDFAMNNVLLTRGQHLGAGAIALAAMGGHAKLPIHRTPKIAIIASGNELVLPGEPCNNAQIPSSNNIMLSALLSTLPCEVHDCGIVEDRMDALVGAFADCADADIIVTSGGASVGDHDLVRPALLEAGAEIDFWRVALRPGKPVLAGKLGNAIVVGLPGNPSSAMVTAFLFLLPLIRHLAGSNEPLPPVLEGTLDGELPINGARAQYLRANNLRGKLTPFSMQDSGLVAPLSKANALIIHQPNADALKCGDLVTYHSL